MLRIHLMDNNNNNNTDLLNNYRIKKYSKNKSTNVQDENIYFPSWKILEVWEDNSKHTIFIIIFYSFIFQRMNSE